MTAIITRATVVGGHDGRAEIEVELTYDNGGTSTISLDEEACTASSTGQASARSTSWSAAPGAPCSRHSNNDTDPARTEMHMLDLVIRNGLIVDGSGLARPPRRHLDPRRQGRRRRRPRRRRAAGARRHRPRRGARLHRPAHPLRRAAVLRPVRVPGDRARHHDRRAGQLLVVAGAVAHGPPRAFSSMFRLIEEMPEAAFDAGVDWRWGEGFGGMARCTARTNIALNVAPARRPLRAAHVRHGRGAAGARGDRRRDRRDVPTCCAPASRPAPSA